MKFNYLLILIMLLIGCSKSQKEKFIEYKEKDSYPIWKDIQLMKEINLKLAKNLDSCNVEVSPVIQLTESFFEDIEEMKDDFIIKNGGLYDDGTLAAAGDISAANKFYLLDKNGQKLIEELQELQNQLKPYGFNLKLKHSYYENRWSKEFSFDEYLFQHEPPEVIFELFNRLKLRIQLELNSYLIDQLSNC